MLAHKHTRLMQPPSLNVKTQFKKKSVLCIQKLLATDSVCKALIDCAMFRTECAPYDPQKMRAKPSQPLVFL